MFFNKIKDKIQARTPNSISSNTINSRIYQAGRDININVDGEFLEELINNSQNKSLFVRLLDEKINCAKEALLLVNISEVESVVNTIENYGFHSIDDDRRSVIAFYGYLIAWQKKDKSSCVKYKRNITNEEFLQEIAILETTNDENTIDSRVLCGCMAEMQSIILLHYFEEGDYNTIIELYQEIYLNVAILRIPVYANYLFALSCMNIGEFSKSVEIFTIISEHTQDDKISFCTICSKMADIVFKQNPFIEFQDKDRLYDMYVKLHTFESMQMYKMNLQLIAQIDLYSSSLLDNLDPKEIWRRLDENLKTSEPVRIAYIRTLYRHGYLDETVKEIEAAKIYSNLDIDFIYITCLLELEKVKEAERYYKNIPYDTNAALDGLYLLIIQEKNPDTYLTVVLEFLEKYENDLEDFYYIASAVNDDSLFDDEVFPRIKLELILSLDVATRMQYVFLTVQHNKLELCVKILKTVELKGIKKEFADELFDNILGLPDSIEKESILDFFIEHNVKELDCIKAKTDYLIRNNRKYAATLYGKRIYELDPTPKHASYLISVMLSIPRRKFEDYKKYESIILESKSPQYLANLAVAYAVCGYNELAENIIYKSLYYLNGQYDDDIFRAFLNVVLILPENKEQITDEKAFVIELKDGFRAFNLCFDSEEDLDQENNFSLGMEHVKKSDRRRAQIMGKTVGETVVFDGKKYEIISIQSRKRFAFQYVSDKLANDRQTPWLLQLKIPDNEPQELIRQLREASHFFDQGKTTSAFHKELLDQYLNIENEWCSPIDCLAMNDYSNYFSAIEELLYTKDFALFAGEPNFLDETNEYVLSLPTLVIAFELNCIDVIDNSVGHYCMTESLKDFVLRQKDRFDSSKSREAGKLVEMQDKQMAFIPPSQKERELWSSLYELCNRVKIYSISDVERAEFSIYPDCKAEQLFLGMNLNVCQLDSLILAERETKVLLADDIFYRKIAETCKVKNSNIASLIRLYGNTNPAKAEQLSLQISESNYIYPPLVWNSLEGFKKVTANMMNGKIKKEYNFPVLAQLMKSIFN